MDTEEISDAAEAVAEKPRRPYQKHGLIHLRNAVRLLGGRVIDKRTTLGKALDAWRRELVADLGGRAALSTQQLALVELATRTKLMLDSIDYWLLTRPTLVEKRKKSLIPAVRERASLAASFTQALKDLGLERKVQEVPSLTAYLRQRRADGPPPMGTSTRPATVDVVAAPEQTPPTSAEPEAAV